jgi:hypothetical protein
LAILSLGVSAPIVPAQNMSLATICSTQWGWCPLDPSLRISAGLPCQCFAPAGQTVAGVTRYFNYAAYQRPVSPYLNPHWTDMPPPPPVIK